jgi:adenylosuccinate lyase
MDPRYQHPAVAELFTPEAIYRQWLNVGRTVVHVQTERGEIPAKAGNAILAGVAPIDIDAQDVAEIQRLEQETRHDVAAFLKWWRNSLGPNAARHIHLGLTSSDLVDTAMGLRFAELEQVWWRTANELEILLLDLVHDHKATVCLGFTHGQPAEPTSLGIRASQWNGMVTRSAARLSQAWNAMRIAKLSGPVGTYAHNPTGTEISVALLLGLEPHGAGASQIVPRDRLAHWASCATGMVQALAKIAIDFRLMARRAEVSEGWPEGRIGSSAMPHKVNPVTAEKLAGMARLAAGYASMLQPVDLWEERDISHSSVERVAVPDLLHVLLYSVEQATSLLRDANWQYEVMRSNLRGAGALPYSAWYMLELQRKHGFPPDEARQGAAEWARHYDGRGTVHPTPEQMLRNHPLTARLVDEQPPVASLFDPDLTPEQRS